MGFNESFNESFKLKESFEIKNTKSLFLKEIIDNCFNVNLFNKCDEGNLVKIDNVSLNFLDEDTQRTISLIQKNMLKGFKVDEFEINSVFSSFLDDYPYFFKGKVENSDEKILLKIPMENKSEFESKYSVNDLLIGKLSIIGIYKGKVDESNIMTNMDYFAEKGNQNILNSKIENSNYSENGILIQSNNNKDNKKSFHYIDIIALIQDVNFFEEEIGSANEIKMPWYKKIFNFLGVKI